MDLKSLANFFMKTLTYLYTAFVNIFLTFPDYQMISANLTFREVNCEFQNICYIAVYDYEHYIYRVSIPECLLEVSWGKLMEF